MKRFTFTLLPLLSALSFSAVAEPMKTVPLQEDGVTTAYVSVPTDLRCNVKIPDVPTAFCAGPGRRIYHMKDIFVSSAIDPQQYFATLLQEAQASSPDAKIVDKYAIPELSQFVLRRDAALLYKRNQQVVTYAFDSEDPERGEKSAATLIFQVLPNNGAPVSIISVFGISVPTSSSENFAELRDQMIRFAQSYRFDDGWVQMANVKHAQFESNLSARERAFSSRQQQIHQSNMDALDRSYASFKARGAASDLAQSQYVDSIRETQQLVDRATGTRYEADGYADYNYVNANDPDMYYRTDNALDNPNINTNQGEDYILLEDYSPRW